MLTLRNLAISCPKQILGKYPNTKNYNKKAIIPVSWEKPAIGWTKLNFDGSSKTKTGRASIGGVFRDHNAEFLLGYTEPIGRASSTVAEFVALRRGLELALENGWRDMWLEGDAKDLFEIITNQRQVIKCDKIQKHVSHINKFILGLDGCIASHVYREGNRTADKLARMGYKLKQPRVWIDPPPEVLRLVHEDAEGKIIFRRK